MNTQKMESIQALRGLAFLGIFFTHACFVVSWAKLGVSVFFVLSGFLMTRKYGVKELTVSISDSFCFAWGKIKKLYPLHIVTMCCSVALSLIYIIVKGTKKLRGLGLEIILNLGLVQTWVPDRNINVSLNGVAWYLSVTLFLYFAFPYIVRWMRNKSKLFLTITCVCLLLGEVLVCVPLILFFGENSSVYIWFMYCFPIFRLGDFYIGCCLGKFFGGGGYTVGCARNTVIEILATLMTILVYEWIKKTNNDVLGTALRNWTTPYIPLAVIWVVLFARKAGLLTRWFTNKVFVNLGNISAYAFLIHYVVVQWAHAFFGFFDIYLHGIKMWMLVFGELGLTVLLSCLYKKVTACKIWKKIWRNF